MEDLGRDDIDSAVKGMFRHIPQILAFHSHLLSELKKCATPKDIANTFKKVSPFFKLYTAYINEYDHYIDSVTLLRGNKKTNSVLESAREACGGRDIMSYLITPVQRIPRFELLLRELRRYSTSDDDAAALDAALDSVKTVAQKINEAKRDAEQKSRLVEILSMLTDLEEHVPPPFLQPSRKFVHAGYLWEITDQFSARRKERFVILLNDLIIWTECIRPNKSYRVKGALPLDACEMMLHDGVVVSTQPIFNQDGELCTAANWPLQKTQPDDSDLLAPPPVVPSTIRSPLTTSVLLSWYDISSMSPTHAASAIAKSSTGLFSTLGLKPAKTVKFVFPDATFPLSSSAITALSQELARGALPSPTVNLSPALQAAAAAAGSSAPPATAVYPSLAGSLSSLTNDEYAALQTVWLEIFDKVFEETRMARGSMIIQQKGVLHPDVAPAFSFASTSTVEATVNSQTCRKAPPPPIHVRNLSAVEAVPESTPTPSASRSVAASGASLAVGTTASILESKVIDGGKSAKGTDACPAAEAQQTTGQQSQVPKPVSTESTSLGSPARRASLGNVKSPFTSTLNDLPMVGLKAKKDNANTPPQIGDADATASQAQQVRPIPPERPVHSRQPSAICTEATSQKTGVEPESPRAKKASPPPPPSIPAPAPPAPVVVVCEEKKQHPPSNIPPPVPSAKPRAADDSSLKAAPTPRSGIPPPVPTAPRHVAAPATAKQLAHNARVIEALTKAVHALHGLSRAELTFLKQVGRARAPPRFILAVEAIAIATNWAVTQGKETFQPAPQDTTTPTPTAAEHRRRVSGLTFSAPSPAAAAHSARARHSFTFGVDSSAVAALAATVSPTLAAIQSGRPLVALSPTAISMLVSIHLSTYLQAFATHTLTLAQSVVSLPFSNDSQFMPTVDASTLPPVSKILTHDPVRLDAILRTAALQELANAPNRKAALAMLGDSRAALVYWAFALVLHAAQTNPEDTPEDSTFITLPPDWAFESDGEGHTDHDHSAGHEHKKSVAEHVRPATASLASHSRTGSSISGAAAAIAVATSKAESSSLRPASEVRSHAGGATGSLSRIPRPRTAIVRPSTARSSSSTAAASSTPSTTSTLSLSSTTRGSPKASPTGTSAVKKLRPATARVSSAHSTANVSATTTSSSATTSAAARALPAQGMAAKASITLPPRPSLDAVLRGRAISAVKKPESESSSATSATVRPQTLARPATAHITSSAHRSTTQRATSTTAHTQK